MTQKSISSRRSTSQLVLLLLSLGLALGICAGVRAVSATDITYVYDDLGRLIAVIDLAGDTAVYTYDAVGNVLSISRFNSSVVSVIHFSPRKGPVGATVTIHGTSFSTTASQNTVTFNGTAATVSSASATQLVVTVPSGATTGPIGVTSPSGSATSTASFTVTSSTAPTITSFTPSMGDPGDTVSITGTNFETVATDNQAKFNGALAPVVTSTTTTLSARAPTQPGMGKISVSTPSGTALSTNEFFIPPPPYTIEDIESTDWLTVSQSKTATVTTAGKVAVVFFQGIAGHRMSIKLSAVTSPGFAIGYAPDGSQISFAFTDGSDGLLEFFSLPATGSYAVFITPRDSSNFPTTGSMTLTLYDVPADVSGTITAGGPPVTITTTVPGQNARLTFSGAAGQKVSVTITSVSIAASDVYIAGADSSILGGVWGVTTTGGYVENVTLEAAGTYEVLVDPSSSHIGSMTLTLNNAPTSPPTITALSPTIGSPDVSVTITGTNFDVVPTGNQVSFNGTSAVVTSASSTSLEATVPAGATSGRVSVTTTAGSVESSQDFFVPPGSYTAADVAFTGRISFGVGQVVSVGAPGKIGMTVFDGVAGHRITLRLSSGTTGWALISILNPSGTDLITPKWVNNDGFVDLVTLTETGTHTIVVDPENANTGNLTLQLYDVPEDPSGTITPGGSPAELTTTTPGQNLSLTFSGTASNRISLQFASTTAWTRIAVNKPDGTALIAPTWVNGSGFFDTTVLPVSGTYTIVADPENANVGTFTFTLHDVPSDASETITAGGPSVTVTMSTPGQNAAVTFSGTSGDKAMLVLSSVTINGTAWSQVSILKPDTTTLVAPTWFNGAGKTLDTVTLPATGTYTIVINPEAANTGSVTLALTNPSIPNDDFTNAQVISGTSSSVSGTNVGATKETGEPNHANATGGKSVWYRWQAPQSADVVFTTAGANFDTLLAVYTGSSVNALTEIASNDDASSDHTSKVTFSAVNGTTYYIAVDGFNGATGQVNLNWHVANTASVQADYQFQNNRDSSVGSPPDLVDLGTNSFTSATVDSTTRTVLAFSQNDGVALDSTTGVVANDAYSIVMLLSIDQTSGYRRLLDVRNATGDDGLYVNDGKLRFYPAAIGSNVSVSASTYVQVVVTRDMSGTVTGYVDGVQQFQFTDTYSIALISGANKLRFFKDDSNSNEASAGTVSRIRIYNGPLTATQVAALDRLPPP